LPLYHDAASLSTATVVWFITTRFGGVVDEFVEPPIMFSMAPGVGIIPPGSLVTELMIISNIEPDAHIHRLSAPS
jgi:hypothetical protein